MINSMRNKLVQKAVDAELSIVDRLLLKVASRFDSSLSSDIVNTKSLSQDLKSCLESKKMSDLDLWSKIDARIDQEERAALFLGERRLVSAEVDAPGRSWAFPSGLVAGGLAVGLIAVVLSSGLFNKSNSSSPSNTQNNSAQFAEMKADVTNQLAKISEIENGNLNLVSSSPQSLAALEDKFYGPNLEHELEVDWMRSSGRFRIVPDRSNQVVAIVVQRPTTRSSGISGRTPQAMSVNNIKR
jgi:hypothetical protein